MTTTTIEHAAVNLKDLIVGDVVYEIDVDGKLYGPDVVITVNYGETTVVSYNDEENISVVYELDEKTKYARTGHIDNVDKHLYDMCKRAADLKI